MAIGIIIISNWIKMLFIAHVQESISSVTVCQFCGLHEHLCRFCPSFKHYVVLKNAATSQDFSSFISSYFFPLQVCLYNVQVYLQLRLNSSTDLNPNATPFVMHPNWWWGFSRMRDILHPSQLQIHPLKRTLTITQNFQMVLLHTLLLMCFRLDPSYH